MNTKPSYNLCRGKVAYDKKGAITAKNSRWKRDRTALRIYECEYEDHWHLTRNTPHQDEARTCGQCRRRNDNRGGPCSSCKKDNKRPKRKIKK